MARGNDPRPGFSWPVAVTRPIAAPAAKVWDAVSEPGNLDAERPSYIELPWVR